MSQQLARTGGDLKSLINSEAIKNQIAKALPKHLTVDRFIRVSTTTLLRVPKLAECDQASFILAMLNCSSLGLEPDGRRCHLIPFENRKLGIVECQLIIDYKGLIELAKRSGDVSTWQAFSVCERDVFSWKNGVVEHAINWLEDRGKVLAYYSQVTGKDGIRDYEVMTRAEVDAIRARSRAANSGPWVSDYDEMGKKTVMRRHSKRLILSPEFHDALEKDGDCIEASSHSIRNVTPPTENPFSKPISLPNPQPEPAPAETAAVPESAIDQVKAWLQASGIKVAEALPAIQRLGIGDGKTPFSKLSESDIAKIASDLNTVEETVWQMREEKENQAAND